jgi:uncharacterized membrane protein
MATLFALLYPDRPTGDQALATVKGLESAGYLTVLDSAFLTKSRDGKIEHHGEAHPVRSGAAKGLVVGALAGVIFSIPVLGIAAGTLTGLAIGRRGAHGEDKDFADFAHAVSLALEPDGSAILLLAESDTPERLLQDLGRHGGHLMSTDLSAERLAEIQAALDQTSST